MFRSINALPNVNIAKKLQITVLNVALQIELPLHFVIVWKNIIWMKITIPANNAILNVKVVLNKENAPSV